MRAGITTLLLVAVSVFGCQPQHHVPSFAVFIASTEPTDTFVRSIPVDHTATGTVYATAIPFLTGQHVQRVYWASNSFGHASLGFDLTPDGADRMARATSANLKRHLVMELDGVCVFAPVIMGTISGKGMISVGPDADLSTLDAFAVSMGAEPLDDTAVRRLRQRTQP